MNRTLSLGLAATIVAALCLAGSTPALADKQSHLRTSKQGPRQTMVQRSRKLIAQKPETKQKVEAKRKKLKEEKQPAKKTEEPTKKETK